MKVLPCILICIIILCAELKLLATDNVNKQFAIGTTHLYDKRYKLAIKYFRKALNKYENLRKKYSSKKTGRTYISATQWYLLTLEKIGDCYSGLGNKKTAIEYYEKALDKLQTFRKESEVRKIGGLNNYCKDIEFRLGYKIRKIRPYIKRREPKKIKETIIPLTEKEKEKETKPKIECPDDRGINGPKIGIRCFTIRADGNAENESTSPIYSWGFGLVFDYPVARHKFIGKTKLGWDVGTNVLYRNSGFGNDTGEVKTTYLTFDAHVKPRFIAGRIVPYLILGLSYNLLLAAEYNTQYDEYMEYQTIDYKNQSTSGYVAPLFGIGIEYPFVYGSLSLEIINYIGLSNTVKEHSDVVQGANVRTSNTKPNDLLFMFGYNYYLAPCPKEKDESVPLKIGISIGPNFAYSVDGNTKARMSMVTQFSIEYIINKYFSTLTGIGYVGKGFESYREDAQGMAKMDYIRFPMWGIINFPATIGKMKVIPRVFGGINFDFLLSCEYESYILNENFNFNHGIHKGSLSLLAGVGVSIALPTGEIGLDIYTDTAVEQCIKHVDELYYTTNDARIGEYAIMLGYKMRWDELFE